MTAKTSDLPAWIIRSQINGRVRIYHPGLSKSLGIRRNCSSILHRTHWLISHRINVISSTVVIQFPDSRKDNLLLILDRCFVDPLQDNDFEDILSQKNQLNDITDNESFRQSIRNIGFCASLLILDALFVVPPIALADS